MNVAEQVWEIFAHPAAPVRTAAMALAGRRDRALEMTGSAIETIKLLKDLSDGPLDLGRKAVLKSLLWEILRLCEIELNPAAGATHEERKAAQEVFEMCWRTLPRLC